MEQDKVQVTLKSPGYFYYLLKSYCDMGGIKMQAE